MEHNDKDKEENDYAPGWHRIEVRTAKRVTLQTRSGYWTKPFVLQP